MSFEFIAKRLTERRDSNLFRSRQVIDTVAGQTILVAGKTYLNFSSNDYLALAASPELIKAWGQGAQRYGVGSGASPLVTGHGSPHRDLEQSLCDWLDVEAVILFNSGFSANQAVIKALLNKGDLLLQDKLAHASLIEAGILSDADMRRFLHNDLRSLQKLLQLKANNKLVVSEGVFSMDGDCAPLPQISQMCQQHDAWLMVDDAHGIGVLGDKGQGSLGGKKIAAQIHMATFGKALGVGGAFVAGSAALIDYLINFSRSYIYSTAMPPAMAVTVSESVRLVQTQCWRRDKLFELIAYFKQKMAALPLQLVPSDTAIQPIILGGSKLALNMSHRLANKGFYVAAIRPPTVSKNSARLRVTLTAQHTKADIDALVLAMQSSLKELAKDGEVSR